VTNTVSFADKKGGIFENTNPVNNVNGISGSGYLKPSVELNVNPSGVFPSLIDNSSSRINNATNLFP